MKAYVIGSSALYYWRHALRSDLLVSKRCKHPLGDCPKSATELTRLQFPTSLFGDGPVHLMVPTDLGRVHRKQFVYSVHVASLPRSAFCTVNQDMCVASPEYCLMQAACAFSKHRLIELCMEFCGQYALDADSARGFSSRGYQLTDVDSLSSFVGKMRREPGVKRLASVLQYIKEGSRSPMETREYMFLCLPKMHGGYGIPRADLNVKIPLNEEEQRQTRRSYIEVDMLWEKGGVIIEYDGHEDHASKAERGRDASKRNVLIARGYKVFTITGQQIFDTDSFDKIAQEISESIGYRLRRFPSNWIRKRNELRRELSKSFNDYEIERFF